MFISDEISGYEINKIFSPDIEKFKKLLCEMKVEYFERKLPNRTTEIMVSELYTSKCVNAVSFFFEEDSGDFIEMEGIGE